jgi:ATP-dependent DNA helicase RecQ
VTEVPHGIDSPVVHTLENLIAPGMRARLSPYVEAAQLFALFGCLPDQQRREASTRTIIEHEQTRIDQLARHWAEFVTANNKDFAGNDYRDPDFLGAYLAYYFSVNVAKVQLVLLDLVRAGEMRGQLRLLDIGVGTGTTAVALLDFLLVWSQVCDLYGEPFPVESVELLGVDRSEDALEWAGRVVEGYVDALGGRATPDGSGRLETVRRWAREARWQQHDLATGSLPDLGSYLPTLVVASNVWNELDSEGHIGFERMISSLNLEASVAVIEPGDERSAMALMRWRRTFLQNGGDWVSVGPCGQDAGADLPKACERCWHIRREAFQPTQLYNAFRKACIPLVRDTRTFDDYANRLLSWSYVILHKGAGYCVSQPIPSCRLEDIGSQSAPIVARYMGTYRARSPVCRDPDRPAADSEEKFSEYLKLCPVPFDVERMAFRRSPGFQIPSLRHGELLSITGGVSVGNVGGAPYLEPAGSQGTTRLQPLDGQPGITSFLPVYTDSTRAAVNEFSHRLFGFEQMRAFQHEILERVLTGRNILGIAATGGGKSECFILPAVLFSGITVVVSPLKSLMHDQYYQRICDRYGLHHLTTFINGDLPFYEREARLRRMEQGCYKLVYFTPEQLERSYVLESLNRANKTIGVRYLAMDEAHCISQWGHDFRPSYLNILRRLSDQGREIRPAIIALTATASPPVRADICEELGLDPLPLDQGGDVLVHSANRPELNFVVRVTSSTAEKSAGIVGDLRKLERYNRDNEEPGAALVFMPYTGGNPDYVTGERGGAQSTGVSYFASYLERTLGRKVAIYHGKMDSDDAGPDQDQDSYEYSSLGDMRGRGRGQQQEAFISGARDVMVATKGFGMGVDKPNIRYVIHRSPPGNLEAYAQEAGRAGRDGEISTAVLYYSPDSPGDDTAPVGSILPSDHEIQRRFLSDKYVRPQDVAAVWAFLQQLGRRLVITGASGSGSNTHAYFTNDEVVGYLDQLAAGGVSGVSAFVWPDFAPREPYARESDNHRAILDRGHKYKEKKNYISRILAVMYRIRPDLPGQGRITILESVHRTGACVHKAALGDWDAILGSNAYFGALLRQSGLTALEFMDLLNQPDLLPLAARLSMPLRDLTGLLSDVRQCTVRSERGRPAGVLLDFCWIGTPKYGPAADKDSLQSWRAYAGAWSRAHGSMAKTRAERGGREYPNDDDYFCWTELNRSVGWEVRLNGDFPANRFKEYLTAFSELMADRQRTDWDSYRRLLTGYIGVRADGQIGEWTKPSNCLRAVMLGYLKSHEVIDGGNCRSCNHCLSEADLDKYTVEQRREVVVRMSPQTEELFERVEKASAEFPDLDVIPALLAEVKAEEERGRSLVRYFEGWSARLLEDEPEHRAGILARIHAMKAGLVSVDGSELGSLAGRLKRLLTSEAVPVVWGAVSDLHSLASGEAETYLVQVAVMRIAGDNRGELDVIRQLLEAGQAETISPSAAAMSEVCLRVRELCQADGALPDAALFHEATIALARTSDDRQVSEDLYAEFFGSKLRTPEGWAEIETELEILVAATGEVASAPVLSLLSVWIKAGGESSRQGRTRDVGEWLEAHQRLLEVLGASSGAANLVVLLDSAELTAYPTAAIWAIRCAVVGEGSTAVSASVGAHLAVKTLSTGSIIDRETAGRLVRWVGQSEDVARMFQTSLLDDQLTDEERSSVLEVVLADSEYDSWITLGRWLELIEISPSFSTRPAAVLGFVRSANSLCMAHSKGAEACLEEQVSGANLKQLQTLVVSSLRGHEKSREAHGELVPMLAALPSSLAEYVEMCLLEGVPPELVEDGFVRLVATGDRSQVLALLRSTRSRSDVVLPQILRQACKLLEALQGLFNTADGRVLEQPKASDITALWSNLTPEASVENADVFVAAIHELRTGWNPAWMTPVAREVEALVMARRYREAGELAGKHPGLRLGSDRKLAAAWIAQARARGEPRFAPPDTTVLLRVASYVIEYFRRS